MSRPAAGRVAPYGLRIHEFAESRRILDRKSQRRGVRVFREASQLYLRGVHVAVSPISGSSSAQVYDFQVQSEHSHWMVRFSSQTLTAAYQGSVWVESENRARPANRDAGPQHTVRFPDGYGRILGGLFVRDDWRDTLSGTLDGARATAISPAAKASGKIR
jgi:hypothetical protein